MQSTLLTLTLLCTLLHGTYGRAEDLTFPKTRWSSPTDLTETDVVVTATDSALKIASVPRPARRMPRLKSGPEKSVTLEIPYSTIARMSYAFTDRRRLLEGVVITPWLLATKAQSHWLVIEHGPGTPQEVTLLRLDKSEFRAVIAALNARTGKSVQVLDPGSSLVDPTTGSKDVEEVVPFGRDQVVTALKASMEGFGCEVGRATSERIECRRGHAGAHRAGFGGEAVTATLEGQEQATRVSIKTSRGFGRNWSLPIYREMRRRLESPGTPSSSTGETPPR